MDFHLVRRELTAEYEGKALREGSLGVFAVGIAHPVEDDVGEEGSGVDEVFALFVGVEGCAGDDLFKERAGVQAIRRYRKGLAANVKLGVTRKGGVGQLSLRGAFVDLILGVGLAERGQVLRQGLHVRPLGLHHRPALANKVIQLGKHHARTRHSLSPADTQDQGQRVSKLLVGGGGGLVTSETAGLQGYATVGQAR